MALTGPVPGKPRLHRNLTYRRRIDGHGNPTEVNRHNLSEGTAGLRIVWRRHIGPSGLVHHKVDRDCAVQMLYRLSDTRHGARLGERIGFCVAVTSEPKQSDQATEEDRPRVPCEEDMHRTMPGMWLLLLNQVLQSKATRWRGSSVKRERPRTSKREEDE